MRQGEKATVVSHCAVSGIVRHAVRKWSVGDVQPYAQYPCSVAVKFTKPRKRRGWIKMILPDDIQYVTIETLTGAVLYDSRTDVPCDMAKWGETAARIANQLSPV
jgi:hypothetical protein